MFSHSWVQKSTFSMIGDILYNKPKNALCLGGSPDAVAKYASTSYRSLAPERAGVEVADDLSLKLSSIVRVRDRAVLLYDLASRVASRISTPASSARWESAFFSSPSVFANSAAAADSPICTARFRAELYPEIS